LRNRRGFNIAIKIEDKDARLVLCTLMLCRFFLRFALCFQRFFVEQFGIEALALLLEILTI